MNNPCEIGIGKTFDLGRCTSQVFLGWIPDWVWFALSFWQWGLWTIVGLVALGALYKIKQLAGWPGVFAALTLGAYGLGRWHGWQSRGGADDPIEMFRDDDPIVREGKPGKGRLPSTKRPRGLPAAESISSTSD